MHRVSVHVASSDLEMRLPALLESLTNQTTPYWQAVVVDNSGKRSPNLPPPVYVLRNPRPQALARSMSQAIDLASDSEFFIMCRSDLVFAPNMLEILLNEFEQDPALVIAWPTLAKASYDPDSTEGELLLGDDRVIPKRPDDLSAACVMIRAQDIGTLRPDPRKSDDIVMRDFIWKLAQTGAKGRQVDEAIAWLQPGATLASPAFFRYLTWVWTRRVSRS